jgi:ribokinase
VSVDLVCGGPAFVDVTFVELEALPALGEERFARDLIRAPGGSALTAIAAARLGLEVALCCPLGADAEGDLIRDALAAEGVRWGGRTVARTPVTVVLPVDGDRAMATYDPGEEVTAAELAAVAPRAAVVGITEAELVPPGARVYVTLGDPEARASVSAATLAGPRALLLNEREAKLLTARSAPEEAALILGEHAECVIVTRGAEGAVGAAQGKIIRAEGVSAEPVDTTGAGDLFCAAFVWADTLGMPMEECVQWAVLYSALSVEVPGAIAGAVTREALLAEGERRGMTVQGLGPVMSTTRRKTS